MKRVYKHSAKSHPLKFDPRATGEKCHATATPKIKWYTSLDALLAIANTNSAPGSKGYRDADGKKECRVYRCEHCDYWHTTSAVTPPPRPKEKTTKPTCAPPGEHPLFRALKKGDS
jgi:hypothetical protein